MSKEKLKDWFRDFASSCNMTIGQLIFTNAGIGMLIGSVIGSPILYLMVMFMALWLAWTFRKELRSL
jgi:uncharacterized protein (DUF2062 family)